MRKFGLDNKGQLSLEYVLSTMIVLLIISLLSIPILLTTIEFTNDVTDSINAKNELCKISDAIDFCYSSGKGSKRLVLVDFNQNVNIRFYNNAKTGIASLNLNLSDNSKEIIDSFNYPYLNGNIHLSKGFNKIVVEWSEETNKIEVNKLI